MGEVSDKRYCKDLVTTKLEYQEEDNALENGSDACDDCVGNAASYSSASELTDVENTRTLNANMTELGCEHIVLPSCVDVEIFGEYYILINDDKVIKNDKQTGKTLTEMTLVGAQRLCRIKQSSCVAVLQMPAQVTIVATKDRMEIVYKINTSKPFSAICHLNNFSGTDRCLPNPYHTFAVSFSRAIPGSDDEIYILLAGKSSVSTEFNKQKLYKENAKLLKAKNIKGISGICSFSGSVIVVSCTDMILCLQYNNNLDTKSLWSIPTSKAVTDVCYTMENKKVYVYASIQDEKRIVKLDKDGNVLKENVLPPDSNTKPGRISVKGGTILVREFNESIWRNLLQEM